MKAKYIIASLVAVCALAIGCTKDVPNVLKEIKVSSSYIGLSNNEGSNTKTITVTAKDSWSVKDLPEWVTVTPASGNAGETKVTFSADKASETRQVSIKIACAGKEQTIIIKQEAEKVIPKTMTVSEALKVIEQYPDGSPLSRVKGVVCKIQEISPSYGNATYYLSEDGKFEDGKWLQVYRGLWMDGEAFKTGDEFALGDELTIEGVLMSYKGTPETKEKEAYVIEINKSLIKCDSLVYDGAKMEALPIEGGNFEAHLTCKGNGVSVVIPDDAKSWLSVSGIQTSGTDAKVFFVAAANEGGDRTTELTFTTTDGTKNYTASASLMQIGSIVECSVADFLAAEVGDTQYRITGLVTKIEKADYGNIYIRDWSGEAYVYGVGAKGDFAKLGVEEGDIITLVGKRGAHNDSPQMTGAQYEKHIDVTEVDFPTFLAAEKSKDVYYRLTGTITNIAKADYGNLYIQDENGNEIYVYGLYPGWGATGDARKGVIAAKGIEVGDKLTVEGYKDVYNDVIELCNGIYVNHEKPVTAE
ncbi:MAG: BACON domain-containing protein [Bacteroidales bacterium]|nr:BACON domain-containing protein [Candidatus Cryptobacteroides choladohippi]